MSSSLVKSTQRDVDCQDPNQVREYAIENYHHFCVEFLNALCLKYENTPTGDQFREQQLKYDMAITHNFDETDKKAKKVELIQSFYNEMQPHFGDVNQGNLNAILEVPFCVELKLEGRR